MKRVIIILIAVAGIAGCYYDKEGLLYPAASDCSGVNASFQNDISAIIQNSCNQGSACHGVGSTNGPGPLTSYTQISQAAVQIKSAVVTGRMPKGSSLPASQIKLISCWVDSGAPDN